MSSIRGIYQEQGVTSYYAASGSSYVNPHWPRLQESLPAILDQLLPPHRLAQIQTCLDYACGSGEFTLVFRSWLKGKAMSRIKVAAGQTGSSGNNHEMMKNMHQIQIHGADPYTFQGYKDRTGDDAFRWSFDDICNGVLLQSAGDDDDHVNDDHKAATDCEADDYARNIDMKENVSLHAHPPSIFDLVVICYAAHLLEKSKEFSFYQALTASTRYLLIVSPTKNKGVLSESHGWVHIDYVSNLKVHSRLYESTRYR